MNPLWFAVEVIISTALDIVPVTAKFPTSTLLISPIQTLELLKFRTVPTLEVPNKWLLLARNTYPLILYVPLSSITVLPLVRYGLIVFWSLVPVQTALAAALSSEEELLAAI